MSKENTFAFLMSGIFKVLERTFYETLKQLRCSADRRTSPHVNWHPQGGTNRDDKQWLISDLHFWWEFSEKTLISWMAALPKAEVQTLSYELLLSGEKNSSDCLCARNKPDPSFPDFPLQYLPLKTFIWVTYFNLQYLHTSRSSNIKPISVADGKTY